MVLLEVGLKASATKAEVMMDYGPVLMINGGLEGGRMNARLMAVERVKVRTLQLNWYSCHLLGVIIYTRGVMLGNERRTGVGTSPLEQVLGQKETGREIKKTYIGLTDDPKVIV